ncbi:transposase, partial [Pseudomonas syringae pv. actinidiae ICMP 19101]
DLLLSIQNAEQNRHWMIPERKGTVRTEVEHYGDGDYLVQMRVSPQARKKNPALPEYWQVRAVTYQVEGNEKTVFTSLPASKFSAEQVATLYHERWEIELGFRSQSGGCRSQAGAQRDKFQVCLSAHCQSSGGHGRGRVAITYAEAPGGTAWQHRCALHNKTP